MTNRRLLQEARNSTWQISVQNVISSFLILILLFVSYSLISFHFYLFYFPGAAAEPLGLRGAQVGNLCSSYYVKVLSNSCRKSWMGPGENCTKTLVWESRVSLTSIYNSESRINVCIRGDHNAVHARHSRGSRKLGLKN